jgi:hypothetical protein
MNEAGEQFDADYYRRYYGDRRTRVHGPREIAKLCNAVTSMLEWWHAPVRTVLDVGAGVGLWRDWFNKQRPLTKYRSTEGSRYACAQYGHEWRDITRWHARKKFDLVVCQGVLPYIDDRGCERAIDNLAAMTGGFLYLEAITKRDMGESVDVKTDVSVHGRSATWYRKRLSVHYAEVGCGLWMKRGTPVFFYELERR